MTGKVDNYIWLVYGEDFIDKVSVCEVSADFTITLGSDVAWVNAGLFLSSTLLNPLATIFVINTDYFVDCVLGNFCDKW